MLTKHHRLPRQFRFDSGRFFNQNSSTITIKVTEADHRAWNQLTNGSQMTLGEIAQSLSRMIPHDWQFICVPRKRNRSDPNQLKLPLG